MAETVTTENQTDVSTSQATDVTSTTVEETTVESAEGKGTLLTSTEGAKEGDKGTTETKTETETKTAGAPEKYEFKAPEGKEFDSSVIDAFSAGAKEANLTQEAAQALLDKVAPVMQARQAEQLESIQKEWRETSTTDKEFGGEKIAENMSVAKKALDQLGTPELRKLLEDTGLGNHPEVIRVLYRAGKAISPDTVVVGRESTAADDAKSMYPNSKMN